MRRTSSTFFSARRPWAKRRERSAALTASPASASIARIAANDEEDAVEGIFDAVDDGEITNTDILDELENIIANKILAADESLCRTAIDDAVAAGGTQEDIDAAEAQLAIAQGWVAAGVTAGLAAQIATGTTFFDEAVGSFEDCWQNAQRAVGALP